MCVHACVLNCAGGGGGQMFTMGYLPNHFSIYILREVIPCILDVKLHWPESFFLKTLCVPLHISPQWWNWRYPWLLLAFLNAKDLNSVSHAFEASIVTITHNTHACFFLVLICLLCFIDYIISL